MAKKIIKEVEATIIPPEPADDTEIVIVNPEAFAAQLCMDSFYDFFLEFWDVIIPEKLVDNWHVKYLCDELQAMAERVFKAEPKDYDLVCNISPGTSKSTVFSVMFPAWVFTRMPSARTICASYSFPLAMDLSRKSRDVVMSEKYKAYFPHVCLRDDQNTKSYFATEQGGFRYAVGVNGSVMGMHAHFIIVDDPLDPKQAASVIENEAACRWLRETLPSRKVNKESAITCLVMQRLGQDDPTAMFLKRGRKKGSSTKVKHICLPAELTHDVRPQSCRAFYKDGLMDPIRLSKRALDEARSDMNIFAYAGQHLQNPVPPEGGMFKTDKIKTIPLGAMPDIARACRFWDKAGTAGGGAYTAGVLIGVTPGDAPRYFVMDVKRVQVDSFTRERLIKRTADDEDGEHVMIGLEQEGGSGGKESAEASVARLSGYMVKVLTVGNGRGDKEKRADPFSVQVNAGNVTMVKGDWNADYIEELKHFPTGTYADQTDASSGAFRLLSKKRRKCGAL